MNNDIKETAGTINSIEEVNLEIGKQEKFAGSVLRRKQPKINIEIEKSIAKLGATANELDAATTKLIAVYQNYRSNFLKKTY